MQTTLKLTPAQLKAARDWCVDCWPDEEGYIRAASAEKIERVVESRWDGGLADFVRCCEP